MSDVTRMDDTPTLVGRLLDEGTSSLGWISGVLHRSTGDVKILLSQDGLTDLVAKHGEKASFHLDILDDTHVEGWAAPTFHLEGHATNLPRTEGFRSVLIQQIIRSGEAIQTFELLETDDNDSTAVHVAVPIRLQGSDQLAARGSLLQSYSYVEVEAQQSAIPRQIAVDVSQMQPGNTLKVCDLPVGNGVQVMTPGDAIVLTIS